MFTCQHLRYTVILLELLPDLIFSHYLRNPVLQTSSNDIGLQYLILSEFQDQSLVVVVVVTDIFTHSMHI